MPREVFACACASKECDARWINGTNWLVHIRADNIALIACHYITEPVERRQKTHCHHHHPRQDYDTPPPLPERVRVPANDPPFTRDTAHPIICALESMPISWRMSAHRPTKKRRPCSRPCSRTQPNHLSWPPGETAPERLTHKIWKEKIIISSGTSFLLDGAMPYVL